MMMMIIMTMRRSRKRKRRSRSRSKRSRKCRRSRKPGSCRKRIRAKEGYLSARVSISLVSVSAASDCSKAASFLVA